MKITKLAAAVSLAAGVFSSANAADITLELTNLTNGIYFTPRLVVAHTSDLDLFQVGTAASTELAWVAEGGSTSQFVTLLTNPTNTANNTHQVFDGLLAPGAVAPYATMTVDDNHTYLSMVSMMLPTNDAFIGLDSWKIPTEAGTYYIDINAYDAGTEANDEIAGNRNDVTEEGTGDGLGGYGVPGFPVPPPLAASIGTGGTGVAIEVSGTNTLVDGEQEGSVHIHRGNLGDTNAAGGASDVDSTVHRWLNPVARLKVVVQ